MVGDEVLLIENVGGWGIFSAIQQVLCFKSRLVTLCR